MWLTQVLIVAAFVFVHLFGSRLLAVSSVPRNRWLSAAGGISVAYVFVHIFPELAEAQDVMADGVGVLSFIEHHAYLVALAGLVVFYSLERVVKKHRTRDKEESEDAPMPMPLGVFWIHVFSFTAYNALIGYLLVHRQEQEMTGLLFFAVALGLHFLVNDNALRQDHKQAYRRVARWILSGAIVFGWLLGRATELGEGAVGILFAFLAGGIVLNVLKEELPEERESRFLPFVCGAFVYALLLLVS